ncbi:ABC transporter permease [Chryseolinea soli]|uniref:ABC transporter permease n=1 Tax=Chryseolinea soli TaxID=2321403 RepID=A0A385SWL4_9BACT|nr:ABC transporter permease [Chryseolinea soli]AYB34671.1 ABC transporter permease [Chryseolinea soli]
MIKVSPPKWADRFLEWYCNPSLLEEIQGDAYELYGRTLKNRGRKIADLQYAWNVLRFFKWSNIKRSSSQPQSSLMMYRNYFTVFKRGFLKEKGYSFLNVFGLAIGIACFLLISLYIRNEYSFDRMHSKADRIYRIHEILQSDGVGERSASQPFPVAEALVNDHGAQIEKAVRFFNFQAPTLAMATIDNTKEFNESRVFSTDSTVFDVFDFPFIEGDPKTALNKPETIVLTESMAKKYFGDESAMGKYLKFQGNTNLLVTGVMRDIPLNTHFQFDCLISLLTFDEVYDPRVPQRWHWYWNPCWTYLLLRDPSDAPQLQAALPAFVKKYFPEFVRNDVTMELFPMTDIHLKSHMDYEIQPNSSLTTLYVFGSIAIFVLLIACINFVNLSTARAANRAKEVGMRKTLGGQRLQLVGQFLFESILLCLLSVVIAIAIVVLLLPVFNVFAEMNVKTIVLLEPFYLGVLTLLPLVVGMVSGIYPAFVLSSFKPITALKASPNRESGGTFRRALVVVQFTLSIVLLVGTGVAMDQLNMLRKSDTGFTRENVIMIPVTRSPVAQNYKALRNEFLRNRNTVSVTALEEVLGAKHQVGNYIFEGQEDSRPFPRLTVRHDFTKTFDIPMVAGRDFSEDVITDDSLALVVNETFVKQMGWGSNEDAIGKKFDNIPTHKIIGVVKDFNFTSRHQPIRPLVLQLNTTLRAFDVRIKYMAVRITGEDVPGTIAWLSKQWKAQIPGWPFEYFFLDSDLEKLYKAETKMSKIAVVFSGLSILVACLGLFGLSTYTAEQRKKEMSIRKVLGGSNAHIFMLFSKHFFSMILIANVVALPLAYFVMKRWLESFAYQVNINFGLFALSALVAVGIALFTISYQAIRSANSNPAEVLKRE